MVTPPELGVTEPLPPPSQAGPLLQPLTGSRGAGGGGGGLQRAWYIYQLQLPGARIGLSLQKIVSRATGETYCW